jgi:hypothetical protein
MLLWWAQHLDHLRNSFYWFPLPCEYHNNFGVWSHTTHLSLIKSCCWRWFCLLFLFCFSLNDLFGLILQSISPLPYPSTKVAVLFFLFKILFIFNLKFSGHHDQPRQADNWSPLWSLRVSWNSMRRSWSTDLPFILLATLFLDHLIPLP